MLREALFVLKRLGGKHYSNFFILVVSLVLLCTPYYSLGYLLIVVATACYIHPLRAFDSYFSNFIIALLIFSTSIMLAGIIQIPMHTGGLPILSVIVYVIMITSIIMYQPQRVGKPKIIMFKDIIIIGVTMILPLAIGGSQFLRYPAETAVYKIVNGDGWDNAAHVGLLQLSEHYGGYLYPGAQSNSDGSQVENSYPQGWHLASSNIAGGFGGAALDTSKVGVFHSLVSYIGIVLVWYMVTMYVFLKYVLYLSKSSLKLNSVKQALIVSVAALLPTLFIMFPSIYQGFVNYMSIIPFIIIIVATAIQFIDQRKPSGLRPESYLSLITPMLAGVALIWTLPLPGLAFMCIYVIIVNKKMKEALVCLKKPLLLLGVLIAVLPVLAYAYILITNIGIGQVYVNTGYVFGFPRPEILAILVLIICLGIFYKRVSLGFEHFLQIMSPLVVYMFVLWILSYIKSGQIGYYQSKMLTLIALVIMLFATAVIIRIAIETSSKNGRTNVIELLCVSVCLMGAVVILSGNPLNLNGLKRLDWNNRTLMNRAIEWTYQQDYSKSDQLVVFDEGLDGSLNNAMLFNLVNINVNMGFYSKDGVGDMSKDALKCINPSGLFYVGTTSQYGEKQVLEKLSNCLSARHKKGLGTTILSVEKNQKYFKTIDTYDAKFIYVKS